MKEEPQHEAAAEKVICKRCHGQGFTVYANTATWHGGIGGDMMTQDVCDKCWGTGYSSHPGPNRRRGESPTTHVERIAKLAADNLALKAELLKCKMSIEGEHDQVIALTNTKNAQAEQLKACREENERLTTKQETDTIKVLNELKRRLYYKITWDIHEVEIREIDQLIDDIKNKRYV